MAEQPVRAAVLTISDGVSHGVREDRSGEAVATVLAEAGYEVERHLVDDEEERVANALRELAERLPLVVTTGGTGLGPRDRAPEATRRVIDREAPGLAEAMRAAGRATTPLADLSRAVAGTAGSALIVNLPGSPKAATESLGAILDILPHALELLSGRTEHGPG